MADLGSSIFNRKAAEKLRSPDDLDKYIEEMESIGLNEYTEMVVNRYNRYIGA